MGVCRIADGFQRHPPKPLISMKYSTPLMLPAVLAALLTSCSSVQISKREITRSEPSAATLVSLSQRAHGWKSSTQIRDVTGVQTCALPISGVFLRHDARWKQQPLLRAAAEFRVREHWLEFGSQRSEERRVGKECA